MLRTGPTVAHDAVRAVPFGGALPSGHWDVIHDSAGRDECSRTAACDAWAPLDNDVMRAKPIAQKESFSYATRIACSFGGVRGNGATPMYNTLPGESRTSL